MFVLPLRTSLKTNTAKQYSNISIKHLASQLCSGTVHSISDGLSLRGLAFNHLRQEPVQSKGLSITENNSADILQYSIVCGLITRGIKSEAFALTSCANSELQPALCCPEFQAQLMQDYGKMSVQIQSPCDP